MAGSTYTVLSKEKQVVIQYYLAHSGKGKTHRQGSILMRGKQMTGLIIGGIMGLILVCAFVKCILKLHCDQLKCEYDRMEEIRRKREQDFCLSDIEESPANNDIFGA